MRMRDGTLKASLEGPQMSSLTKLVFVASVGCPRHATCPGGLWLDDSGVDFSSLG